MYELKSSRKSTRNKKIVARIKQQSIKAQEFFCVYFRVSLCYHSHNRKVKLEDKIIVFFYDKFDLQKLIFGCFDRSNKKFEKTNVDYCIFWEVVV